MNLNKVRVLFGKNINDDKQMEVAMFYNSELLFSSGQATYLRKVAPETLPESWAEIAKGNLVVSGVSPFFDGNTLEETSGFFSYQFFHMEQQAEVEYNLPRFKQEEEQEKRKNMRQKVLIDDVSRKLVALAVTNRNNASFFFGCGGRHFVTLPKILKPLYDFRSGTAILSSGLEIPDDQFVMSWREEDVDGIQQSTLFKIFKKVI